MTSKELNEILNKTRRTQNISLTPEQVEELIKDLEVLELLNTWLVYDEYDDSIVNCVSIPLDIKEKLKEWLDE